MAGKERFIGLMSGTSLDGVDAVLMDFSGNANRVVGNARIPYDDRPRPQLLALHRPHPAELHNPAALQHQSTPSQPRAAADFLQHPEESATVVYRRLSA